MRGALSVIIISMGALVMTSACSRDRQYELRGQVLAVDASRRELMIRHEDIPGFMPAMTMPFRVRDEALLKDRVAGELVRATLVVQRDGAYLSAIERTGEAPLSGPPPAPRVDVLREGDPAPDLAFVDAAGGRHRLSEWRGRAVAVTFIYTRCPLPDFCPLMDRHFASVQDSVKRDPALAGRVRLLSVTFDPEFDTPAVLREHASRAQADPAVWVFATGDPGAIGQFAARFGVSIVRGEGASRDIVHNLRTAVIDPAGKITTIISGNDWTPAELVDALRSATGPSTTGAAPAHTP